MILNSDKNSLLSDYSVDSNILIVTFGGIAQGIGIPVFEFFNLFKDHNLKKIFVRDFNQSWYHQGLLGLTTNIEETARLLQLEINKSKADKVVFFGNSSGGYAALLFGNLLAPDKVYSFSPQTFLSRKKRLLYFDFRWHNELKNVYRNNLIQNDFFDLKKKFESSTNVKTKFIIHYCNTFRLDRIHAEQLSHLNNYSLIKHPGGGHGLIKKLKETGELKKIIEEALFF